MPALVPGSSLSFFLKARVTRAFFIYLLNRVYPKPLNNSLYLTSPARIVREVPFR
jgi:hypothetical protein